jgi:hypothetical protein
LDRLPGDWHFWQDIRILLCQKVAVLQTRNQNEICCYYVVCVLLSSVKFTSRRVDLSQTNFPELIGNRLTVLPKASWQQERKG